MKRRSAGPPDDPEVDEEEDEDIDFGSELQISVEEQLEIIMRESEG